MTAPLPGAGRPCRRGSRSKEACDEHIRKTDRTPAGTAPANGTAPAHDIAPATGAATGRPAPRIGFVAQVDHSALDEGRALFRTAEELGYDAGYVRVRHLQDAPPSPPLFLSVLAQHTDRIELGTAVIPPRFENAGRLAEDLATAYLLTGGRSRAGLAPGYSAHDAIYARAFGALHGDHRDHVDRILHDLLSFLDGEIVAGADAHIEEVEPGTPRACGPRARVAAPPRLRRGEPGAGGDGGPTRPRPAAGDHGPRRRLGPLLRAAPAGGAARLSRGVAPGRARGGPGHGQPADASGARRGGARAVHHADPARALRGGGGARRAPPHRARRSRGGLRSGRARRAGRRRAGDAGGPRGAGGRRDRARAALRRSPRGRHADPGRLRPPRRRRTSSSPCPELETSPDRDLPPTAERLPPGAARP
ncbi:LLM class flavin-dependent oxidoreductase [Brachybacterium sp. GPGPB12]|uniref:LLM class flavin-dependent oxidoreductase n=1 Tax=Brachybacterium sp. GPGPB12 TaxID=3023517 RepID=UPI0031345ED6